MHSHLTQKLAWSALALIPGAIATAPYSADAGPISSSEHPNRLDPIQSQIQSHAHLQVPGSCKWGHAAFEPTDAFTETLVPEARLIYASMDNA